MTWACLGWFLVLGGLAGSWEPYGLKERYVFYLQPLLLLALVLWAERAEARRLRFVLPVVAAVALAVAFMPLRPLLTAGSLPGNALGMEVFRRLGNVIGFGGGLRALLVVAVVALSLLALVRRGRWVVVGLCAAFVVVASGFAARLADDQARAVAATAQLPSDRSWVDAAVGKDADVVLLNAANFMPETLRRRLLHGLGTVVGDAVLEPQRAGGRQPRLAGAAAAPAACGHAGLGDGCRHGRAGGLSGALRPALRGTRAAARRDEHVHPHRPGRLAGPPRLRDRRRVPGRPELGLRRLRPLGPGGPPRPHRRRRRPGAGERPRRGAGRERRVARRWPA